LDSEEFLIIVYFKLVGWEASVGNGGSGNGGVQVLLRFALIVYSVRIFVLLLELRCLFDLPCYGLIHMASAAVFHSDPRSQPMRAAFGSADEHEGVGHACEQISSVPWTVFLYIWRGVRSVFEIKRNDNTFEDTTKPAMTNAMDQTFNNTGIDNDKSKTIQPASETETPSKEDAIEYPPPAQAAFVMLALLLALFLAAIVRIPTTLIQIPEL
jgi:hypothetical protein